MRLSGIQEMIKMKIGNRQECSEIGEAYIKNMVEQIVKAMPDLTEEEYAILNAGSSVTRLISTKGMPLALYNKVLSSVRETIGGKTFDTEKIDVSEQPIYEKEAEGGILLSIFYKKQNALIIG